MAQAAISPSSTALLLIDVINPFDFKGGRAFARRAARSARMIARLRDRAHRAGVPVVYVNDNFGKWRSDFNAIVAACSRPGAAGAAIAALLKPTAADFFVLKPHLSGFHETPLDTLLQRGHVKTVVLAGYATDDCVEITAAGAHMRDYRVFVPSDCVASERDEDRRHALGKMKKFFDAAIGPSARVRLRR